MMSFASCRPSALPWLPPPMSPTCRDFYRVDRLRHIRVAYLRRIKKMPLKKVASRYRVSVRTIQYWVDAALGYEDSEAETLRQMIQEGRRD
jgi:uncharacterized protein YjcR